jgi:TonB family protein
MAAAGYLWQDPGDTIVIQVSLELVERLGAAVQQALGNGPRGTEIGGFLLGRMLPGRGPAVLVEDFELAPCQHLRGVSYTLSTVERHNLGGRLKRRRNSAVVGFFRSHTRPGLYMDQDDFAVFSRYFGDPSQVFLLVRPEANGPATGGFFFWEEGDINRRAPYRQFPFDRKRLGGAASTAIAPRLAPVPVPKPAAPAARRLPPLSLIIVPAIAALFLIAALFVSPRDTKPLPAPAKANPPIETLLPEPVPQAVVEAKAPVPEPPTTVAEPPTAATFQARVPVKRRALNLPSAPRPVVRPRQLEAPPALDASLPTGALSAMLPTSSAAPPMAAEVTYETPHAGVFRRALRKIAAEDFMPPSPVQKITPVSHGNTGVVDVKVFIDESGNVTRAQALTKHSDLADEALAAARQWRFTPARKHDKPAASEMVLHFRF